MTTPRYTYLGPEGTFTELAMRAIVGDSKVTAMPALDVVSAIGAVRADDADFAVVAIENTVEGGVTATLDTLAVGSPLVIVAETVLPVSFELAVRPGTTRSDVHRIAGHSHALAQTRRWLHQEFPEALAVPATSNAAAAVALADSATDSAQLEYEAVLAPPGLAERLGLTVLHDEVADNPDARTRFVKIGRPAPVGEPTGADKTTLSVHLPEDRAGALLEMLEQFAARGVNLSRIESRPRVDRPGEYSFSIDALGHIAEERMAEVLVGLKRTCPLVTFLGSYPIWDAESATPIASGTTEQNFADARAWVTGLRAGAHEPI